MAEGPALIAPPQRLPGCNTLIALAFVAEAILIPVILLIHRTNPLARLGRGLPACMGGRRAANRKRIDSSQSLPPRRSGFSEVRKNGRKAERKATGRVFKEEARSALKAKAETSRTHFPQVPERGTCAFGQGKRGGTKVFGRTNRIAELSETFGRRGTATEPTGAERPRPEPVSKDDAAPAASAEEEWGLVATPAPICVWATRPPSPLPWSPRAWRSKAPPAHPE
jgi:hypothetical protein